MAQASIEVIKNGVKTEVDFGFMSLTGPECIEFDSFNYKTVSIFNYLLTLTTFDSVQDSIETLTYSLNPFDLMVSNPNEQKTSSSLYTSDVLYFCQEKELFLQFSNTHYQVNMGDFLDYIGFCVIAKKDFSTFLVNKITQTFENIVGCETDIFPEYSKPVLQESLRYIKK